jgi:hypothetical protein
MSEEKIIQHAEKAIDILTDKKKSWKKKLKGIIEEILIIVFAVTLTIALHNWNDHKKERKIEQDFLAGIKSDLNTGKKSIEEGVKDFEPTINYYDTVAAQIFENRVNKAFVDTNSGYLLNTLYFVFDKGRFEGFKSSGYLRLIENKELMQKLISFYTTTIPFEEDADKNVFRTREQDFNLYIGMRAPLDSSGVHISSIITQPEARYQVFRYSSYFKERKQHKLDMAKQIEHIVADIDKELQKF